MYYQNGSASCFKARLSERETLNLRVFTPSFNPNAILLSVHIGYGFGLAPVYLASPTSNLILRPPLSLLCCSSLRTVVHSKQLYRL